MKQYKQFLRQALKFALQVYDTNLVLDEVLFMGYN